jgi:nucleoid-associated protein YgaU
VRTNPDAFPTLAGESDAGAAAAASSGPLLASQPSVQAASASGSYARGSAARRHRTEHRTHVVRPGESLWSISRDMLGAGADDAAIARGVDQLWRLNAEAIGTGSPELIRPGQRLLLPANPA